MPGISYKECKMDKKTKDFWFSCFLALFSLFAVISGYQIVHEASLPPYNIDSFVLSPGLLPVVLGYVLLFCSVILWIQSVRSELSIGESVRNHIHETKKWLESLKGNENVVYTLGGLLIVAFYTFVLLANFSFVVSSLIFLIALMLFLRSTNLWKIVIISVVTIALLVLLFQVCFNTVLP